MIIHEDNPFKDDIRRMLDQSKNSTKTYNAQGQVASEEVTITYRKEYLPFAFTKVFQDKELLEDLSPWAWKIVGYIALNLGFNQQKIHLTAALVGIDPRKYGKTIIELLGKRIIVKEKPGCYWVNVTLVVVGTVTSKSVNGE